MHDDQRPDLRQLEATAYQQGGYFTVPQARESRISKTLLNHYVSQGRFLPVRRGLYRMPTFPVGPHDDIREKWMAVGQRAIISHESALAMLDLSDNIPDAVHLLVARRDRGMRRPSGIVLHTYPDNEAIPAVTREGMPLTSPARTLVDVLGYLQPDQLVQAVRQALDLGLVTKSQLANEARRRDRETRLRELVPDLFT